MHVSVLNYILQLLHGWHDDFSSVQMEGLVKSLPGDRDEEQLKSVSDEMKQLIQSLDTHKYEINKKLNEFKDFLLNEFKTSLNAQIKATHQISVAFSESMMEKWEIFLSEITAKIDAMSAKFNDQIQKIEQLHDNESVQIRNIVRELRIDVTDVSTNYVKKISDNDENLKDLKQQQKRLEQQVRISLNDSSRSKERNEKVEEKLKLLKEQNQEQEKELKLIKEQNQEQEKELKLLKEQNQEQENKISTLEKKVMKHENRFQAQDGKLSQDVIAAGKS